MQQLDFRRRAGKLHAFRRERNFRHSFQSEFLRQLQRERLHNTFIERAEFVFGIGLLKKHKTAQAEQRLKLGQAWKNPNLVFTNLSGGFYLGTNMNNKLKRIIAGTDLPQDLHLHSMRHTHASLLINSDVAARVIADRLGHSTTKTTLDTYSHVFAESEARAMQAVDMALFRRTK